MELSFIPLHPFVQFRFLIRSGTLAVFWRDRSLAEIPITRSPTRIELNAEGTAAIDMVRAVQIPEPEGAICPA
jgi:hypothetical protein